jgi:hypothetical protein
MKLNNLAFFIFILIEFHSIICFECPINTYDVEEPVNLIALGDWGGINRSILF